MDQKILITKAEREALIEKLVGELPVLRLKLGVSQDELANLLDISRQTYSSLETRKRKMSWSLYLSLILIFYHNAPTRDFITKAGLLPRQLMHLTELDVTSDIPSFLPLAHDDIRNYLDEQAIHAVETVIMMEFARCNNLSGETVIKAFEGSHGREVSEEDRRAHDALARIRAAKKDGGDER